MTAVILGWVLNTAVPAIMAFALPWVLRLINSNVHNTDVRLIAEAAARAAGRVITNLAAAASAGTASGNLGAAVKQQVAIEVMNLKAMLPETIAKIGVSDKTLDDMITGEIGKLLPPSITNAIGIQGVTGGVSR